MDNEEKLRYIRDRLTYPCTLEQFAEECSEAAHAALKLSRYLRKENPCSEELTYNGLVKDLQKEVIDIFVSMDVIHILSRMDLEFVHKQKDYKIDRWYERLQKKEQ